MSSWVCSTLLIASRSQNMRSIRHFKTLSKPLQPRLFLKLSKELLVIILCLIRTSLFSYLRTNRPWTNGIFIDIPWLDLRMKNPNLRKRPKKESSQRAKSQINYNNGRTYKNITRVTLSWRTILKSISKEAIWPMRRVLPIQNSLKDLLLEELISFVIDTIMLRFLLRISKENNFWSISNTLLRRPLSLSIH